MCRSVCGRPIDNYMLTLANFSTKMFPAKSFQVSSFWLAPLILGTSRVCACMRPLGDLRVINLFVSDPTVTLGLVVSHRMPASLAGLQESVCIQMSHQRRMSSQTSCLRFSLNTYFAAQGLQVQGARFFSTLSDLCAISGVRSRCFGAVVDHRPRGNEQLWHGRHERQREERQL